MGNWTRKGRDGLATLMHSFIQDTGDIIGYLKQLLGEVRVEGQEELG